MDARRLIQEIQDLPTIPGVVERINREEKKRSLTARRLADIIATDPALTSKVLRLANSAYYGLARQVSTLDRAVTVLGFDTLKSLALSVSVFETFAGHGGLAGLWFHSLGCAVATKNILRCGGSLQGLEENGFVAGILHDVGKLAIIANLADEAAQVRERADSRGRPHFRVEKELLGFTHQQVGAMLADRWNFPPEYVAAIRHHHDASPRLENADPTTALLADSVFVGNQLAKALRLGASTDPVITPVDSDTWKRLGITRSAMPELKDRTLADFDLIRRSWEFSLEVNP